MASVKFATQAEIEVRLQKLSENFLDHFAMHIGQAKVAALKRERQPGVVDTKAIQYRGVEIVHVDRLFNDVVAELVGAAVNDSRLYPATREPHAEATPVVIATVVVFHATLAINGPPELTAPNDKRIVKQTAPF